MIQRLARTFSLLFNLGLFALAVAAAVPGMQRVVVPESYGLTQVADRVWTDAPARSDELRALANKARDRVRTFFGDEPPRPTLVLCTTATCAADFGIRGNGLSLADMAVMVSPGGLTLGTLTHEMTHSRLHRRMGVRNILQQPYPTWFDEGLATHVANHPNWQGAVSGEHRARIREVNRFWQWDDAYRELGVGRAYSAAAAEVAAIERAAGRDGLLELIARAEAGEKFHVVLNNLLTR
ncbi:MAG: hypothetical protein QNJ20_19170 [Paracoccaceae bacterium]|nr:hypothetical protein [Paracoccaceae bacterium]